MKQTPSFWSDSAFPSHMLRPLSAAYALGYRMHRRIAQPEKAPIPVICVGNLTAGGAGKTPVAMDMAARLAGLGYAPHLISRGYGGSEAGPLRVDPAIHGAGQVGDEPLLLARSGPCWVARRRIEGVQSAAQAGARVAVLDDGMQHHALIKDMVIVVADGGYGFGNGRLLPAGPLREPVAEGLGRADALVVVGEDRCSVARQGPEGLPVFFCAYDAVLPDALQERPLLAFAGIGRPEKFYASLRQAGGEIVRTRDFPDHYPYKEEDIHLLLGEARREGWQVVTTEKDWVRLPAACREKVTAIKGELRWREPELWQDWLAQKTAEICGKGAHEEA